MLAPYLNALVELAGALAASSFNGFFRIFSKEGRGIKNLEMFLLAKKIKEKAYFE